MPIIGKHSYSVTGDIHHADIGDYCSIAGGVTFHGPNNHAWVKNRDFVSTFPFNERFQMEDYPMSALGEKKTIVGNDVWIGISSFILSGIVIGDGAIIGAHSVVTKDVPPYAIVSGNPGRVTSFRFDDRTIFRLLKIKWWNWSEEKIRKNIGLMKNVYKFVEEFYEMAN